MARYDAKKLRVADAGREASFAIARKSRRVSATRGPTSLFASTSDFADYLWDFVDGKPKQNRFRATSQVPAQTALAEKISKDLRQKRVPIRAGRRSSMPSCRRRAWSTIIWCAAIAISPAWTIGRRQACADGAAQSASRARLAANAVGTKARSPQSIASRYRDRGYRAWLGAGGAMERPDQG